MKPLNDSLTSQLLPIRSLSGGGLELAAKAADINATVISSKLIISTLAKNSTVDKQKGSKENALPNAKERHNTQGKQQFQITISTGTRNYLLSSNTPIDPGTNVQIKMTEQGLVITAKTNDPKQGTLNPRSHLDTSAKNNLISSQSLSVDSKTQKTLNTLSSPSAQHGATSATKNSASDGINQATISRSAPPPQTTTASRNSVPITNNRPTGFRENSASASTYKPDGQQEIKQPPAHVNKQHPQAPSTSGRQTLQPQQIIDQGIRQFLPQQQALKLLVPVLQQIIQNSNTSTLPPELPMKIKQLLAEFSTPNTIQKPLNLKTAIQNSGIFLEAKLGGSTANTSPAINKKNTDSISSDLKTLIQQLVATVSKNTSVNSSSAPALGTSTKSASAATPTITTAAEIEEHELLAPVDVKSPASPNQNAGAASITSNADNIDIVLRQLSRQLLASIAKIQLNQLESLAPRRANNAENQGPNNSWFLEIPIVNGRHVDNLEMRIDQEEYYKNDEGDDKDAQTIWTVMLNFDLHALGKMNVQLKVLDKSVTATIWSQQENTHAEVKQHIQFLFDRLEKVGVTVNQLDCKLGVPPKSPTTLYRQLVDVRT